MKNTDGKMHNEMSLDSCNARIEALEGALRKWKCPTCHGTGKVAGECDDPNCGDAYWDHVCGTDEDVDCNTCGGTGVPLVVRALLPAPRKEPLAPHICPDCGGSGRGKSGDERCEGCRGEGELP